MISRKNFKRFIDLAGGIFGLLCLLPIYPIIAVLIKLSSRGPVLFKQARTGKNGKVFTIYKFRTMKDIRDETGALLPDEKRLTWIGKFLRRFSLDELPEFLNVVKGDISLVGPRPLLVKYLNLYTPEQAKRHKVKPGLTGLAQINGRNAITWEEKFKYDVWYVDNWSIWLDFKILFFTVWKVIKGEGINQKGQATVEEFKGNETATVKSDG
jgi:sugar transferase EpsL